MKYDFYYDKQNNCLNIICDNWELFIEISLDDLKGLADISELLWVKYKTRQAGTVMKTIPVFWTFTEIGEDRRVIIMIGNNDCGDIHVSIPDKYFLNFIKKIKSS